MSQKLSAKKVVGTSVLVNVSDVALNFTVAWLTGSMVMLTEGLQGLADLSTTLLLWIGLKRSKRRPNKQHSFGYGREIYFWTLMASVVMFAVTATLSIYFGWQRFMHPEVLERAYLAHGMLGFALFSNGYALSLDARRLMQSQPDKPIWQAFFDSPFIETKATFIADLMGTTAALLGLVSLFLYSMTQNGQFDGLGAVVVGGMIAILSIVLMGEIKDMLIGRSATPEVEVAIREAVLATKGVEAIADIRTMYMGTENLMVNLEVDLDRDLKTESIERLIDHIEKNVHAAVPAVTHVHIELESAE